MPLYEFRCDTCGPFEQWRSLDLAGEPMPCPTCQLVAKRIYSVAGLILTPAALRRRVEQSAEPKVVKHSHKQHSASHQHDRHHGRPWMIGH